jgi:hypothetical protein
MIHNIILLFIFQLNKSVYIQHLSTHPFNIQKALLTFKELDYAS